MRHSVFTFVFAIAACALVQPGGVKATLLPADAATALAVGERVTMSVSGPSGARDGQDPLILLRLRHADGRVMVFEAANHAPFDVMAQTPGGPLASVMGLADAAPALYHARREDSSGAPFICPGEGPLSVGVFEAPDGSVSLVGLRGGFDFETRSDGSYEPLPYSPNLVCARMRFTRR